MKDTATYREPTGNERVFLYDRLRFLLFLASCSQISSSSRPPFLIGEKRGRELFPIEPLA